MCNKKNVQDAINIMERAGKVDMYDWQNIHEGVSASTEEELHTCGTAACFAGWVAVSPEFKAFGGRVCKVGAPLGPTGSYGEVAIGEYLGIDRKLAEKLTFIDGGYELYGKRVEDVTKEDVIEKLKLILSGELK